MSDKKDQTSKPPSQSTDLPIKKRDLTKTMPSYKTDDDILFSRMDKNMKLSLLQERAYYYVLQAFSAESPAISSPRIMILQELMKEFSMKHETHTAIENAIKAGQMIQQLRNVSLASGDKEMQKLAAPEERTITGVDGQPLRIRVKQNKDDVLKIQDSDLAPEKIQDGKVIAPAKIQDEEANLRPISYDLPVPSWGQVSPGSLIGECIKIQLPGEYEYIEFLIKEYNEKTETHYLVSVFTNKDVEDPCNWVDLRHIPTEDITWQEGHPRLPKWKCFLKPGETRLHKTSTARNRKQIQEVGKSSSGIPIIRKVDKGKSIVDTTTPMQEVGTSTGIPIIRKVDKGKSIVE